MVNYMPQPIDLTFTALSHPIRRGILARLSTGKATVAELAKPHHVSAPAISKHLRILETSGLLVREKKGREHHCALNGERLQEAEQWLEHYRSFWEQSLDRLALYLEETKKQTKGDPHARHNP